MRKKKTQNKQGDIETQYDEDEEKKFEGIKHTRNPKLLCIESFKNVKFYQNALLWPILSIKISDDSSYFGQGQSLEVKLPLIKYVDFLTIKEKNDYTKILEKAYKYKTSILDKSLDSVEKVSEEPESEDLDDLDNESEYDEENKNGDDAEGESHEADSEGSEEESESKNNYEDSDIDALVKEGEDEEKDKDNQYYQAYRHNLKEIRINTLEAKYKPKYAPLMNLWQRDYIDIEDVVTLKVHKEDKEFESFQRNREINKLKRMRDFYTEKMIKARLDEVKKRKREKIIRTKFAIEKLEDEIMYEDKFWGFVGENDNEFEYGRPVLNDQIYEATLKIPYLKFEINSNPEMTFQELKSLDTRHKGLNNEDPHLWLIKLGISVEQIHDQDENKIQTQTLNEDKETATHTKDHVKMTQLESSGIEYPFRNHLEELLEVLKEETSFLCRVYIVRWQNLAAVTSSTDVKDMLAGYISKSSSNPYLRITIGNGQNDGVNGVKHIDDRSKAISNDLNPEFFQSYEFDVNFPEDWQLKIEVCSANHYNLGIFSDEVIGETVIDLEDRYYGNPEYAELILIRFMQNKKKIERRDIERTIKKKNKDKNDIKIKIKELSEEIERLGKRQIFLKNQLK